MRIHINWLHFTTSYNSTTFSSQWQVLNNNKNNKKEIKIINNQIIEECWERLRKSVHLNQVANFATNFNGSSIVQSRLDKFITRIHWMLPRMNMLILLACENDTFFCVYTATFGYCRIRLSDTILDNWEQKFLLSLSILPAGDISNRVNVSCSTTWTLWYCNVMWIYLMSEKKLHFYKYL